MEEHERYTWAIATATRLARRMRLPDRDDAVGQALLVFHQRILPAYDGRRSFETYAAVALRRNLLESLRNQLASKLLAVESLDHLPARPERTTLTSTAWSMASRARGRSLPPPLSRPSVAHHDRHRTSASPCASSKRTSRRPAARSASTGRQTARTPRRRPVQHTTPPQTQKEGSLALA